jgi:sRNA-binding carbon storage regulator CsrA
MLVLSRLPEEVVEILGRGLKIAVKVVETRGKRVQLELTGTGVTFVRSEIAPLFAPDPTRERRGGPLLLSRKEQERILCYLPSGEVAEIVVVRVSENKVRLGFEFSDAFKILREELREAA